MRYIPALCGVLLCLAGTSFHAQTERARAYVGAEIIPINSPPIQNGVLVVQNGKITAVGTRGSTAIPPGADVVDATGKVIMPGIVDTHSHIGGGAGGDSSGPIQPETRILDSINVRESDLT